MQRDDLVYLAEMYDFAVAEVEQGAAFFFTLPPEPAAD
jgi:hypothetical protein